jgi:multiple sugar transport system substrate-binding protein
MERTTVSEVIGHPEAGGAHPVKHAHKRWRAAVVVTAGALLIAASAATLPFTAAAQDRVTIEWFVGLGTGGNPEQFAAENAVVEAFNASQEKINLVVTIVDNDVAYSQLATRIAAGDSPDIIGPIGIRALQAFGDQLLDLTPYIADVDLSEIPQSLIDVYKLDGAQIGIPTAVYPSFIYYNRALFEEAGVPEPPHKVGEQYDGKDWTWDTVAELAKLLTVDAAGNDATSAEFDPENVLQWGLDSQWASNDARAWSTIYGGSGSVLADDGVTAQWPDNWRQGLQFFYDGIWDGRFVPNKQQIDGLGSDNTFQSGKVAMDIVHMWYVCCIVPASGEPAVTDWDIAALPTGLNGSVTSKLHADTIGILAATENPDEAFEALNYLAAAPELTAAWGAMPARPSQQDAFFQLQSERFAPLEIDWQVAKDMLAYPDIPSHEAFMPNFDRADAANKEFGSKLWTTSGLDLNAAIDEQVATLQSIFDEAD